MLNAMIERENRDRFIMKDRVSLDTTSTSPFERSSSVVLLRNLGALSQNRSSLVSWTTESPKFGNTSVITEENYIENASKDLLRYPNNPFHMNNFGKMLLNSGRFLEAIKLFEGSLRIKPDFDVANLNLATAYEMQGQDDTAMKIYKDFLVLNPNDIRATVNIGNLHFKSKRIKEAKEVFEMILKDNPDNVTALDKLSIIYLLEGNPEKSIGFLKKCRSLNANLPAVYNNLGVAYAAMERYKNAIESFKIALKLSPYYRNAVINLATALEKENEIEHAVDNLEDYLKAHESRQAQELLAKFYMKLNKPQRTLYNLRSLLTKSKETGIKTEIGRILNNIGVVYHKIQELDNAEKSYLECVQEIEYAHPAILANLMDLNFDLNRYDKVKYYLDILRSKFPDNKLFYYYEGKLLYRLGDIKEAVKLLKLSIEQVENLFPPYQLLGYIYCEIYKDLNNAIEIAEKAVNKWPDNLGAINNLAYYYLRNNQIDKARILLKKVENLKNLGICLNATIGLLKIKEGHIEEGSSLYNFAQKLAGNTDTQKLIEQKKNLELGRYYLDVGNLVKAKDYFEKVFSIRTTDNLFVKEAQELYEKAG